MLVCGMLTWQVQKISLFYSDEVILVISGRLCEMLILVPYFYFEFDVSINYNTKLRASHMSFNFCSHHFQTVLTSFYPDCKMYHI